MGIPKYWDKEKIKKLEIAYKLYPKEEVLNLFPGFKWRTLQNIANKLKIKREFCSKRNGNIEKLFDKSFESFYWLGLIVSDGTISNNGELKVELSVLDGEYLKNMAIFLNSKVNYYPRYQSDKNGSGTARIKIKDIKNGSKLRKLLKINGLKTYNPVSIEFIKNKSELVSFLGGLIDGDGTIDKRGYINIDMHKNYHIFLSSLGDKLIHHEIIDDFNVIIYKDMSRLSLPSNSSLKIKKMLLDMGLPIMNRKWDRISNDTKIKNYLLENKEKIIMLRKEGKTLKEICEIISYKSLGTLSKFIKNNK